MFGKRGAWSYKNWVRLCVLAAWLLLDAIILDGTIDSWEKDGKSLVFVASVVFQILEFTWVRALFLQLTLCRFSFRQCVRDWRGKWDNVCFCFLTVKFLRLGFLFVQKTNDSFKCGEKSRRYFYRPQSAVSVFSSVDWNSRSKVWREIVSESFALGRNIHGIGP